MSLFEAGFRRKFRPYQGGYLIRHRDGDMLLSAEQVDDLIASRERIWRNPVLWLAWLVIGVFGPWAIANSGGEGSGGFAILFAVLGAVILLVALVSAQLAPYAALGRLIPSQSGREMFAESLAADLLWLAVAATAMLVPLLHGSGRLWAWYLVWGLHVALRLYALALRYRRWRRGFEARATAA